MDTRPMSCIIICEHITSEWANNISNLYRRFIECSLFKFGSREFGKLLLLYAPVC